MSLEKAIKHGKEKRKNYYGSQSFDHSCRPHGGCPYCENNRKFSDQVNRMKADKWEQIDEYIDMIVGAGDPIDALLDVEDKLIDKMGWDAYVEQDKYTSEDWSMQ
jgi:hypothetical protein